MQHGKDGAPTQLASLPMQHTPTSAMGNVASGCPKMDLRLTGKTHISMYFQKPRKDSTACGREGGR
jgi:hypothetical protein